MPTHVAKCGLGAAWRRTGWQPHACPLHPRAGGGTRLHLQTSTAMGGAHHGPWAAHAPHCSHAATSLARAHHRLASTGMPTAGCRSVPPRWGHVVPCACMAPQPHARGLLGQGRRWPCLAAAAGRPIHLQARAAQAGHTLWPPMVGCGQQYLQQGPAGRRQWQGAANGCACRPMGAAAAPTHACTSPRMACPGAPWHRLWQHGCTCPQVQPPAPSFPGVELSIALIALS